MQDGFRFMQISDSHIGFAAERRTRSRRHPAASGRPDPRRRATAGLAAAYRRRDASVEAREFDTGGATAGGAGLEAHYVPGEHDVLGDDGTQFFDRFATARAGPAAGYSFDQGGVHFLGLNNVWT